MYFSVDIDMNIIISPAACIDFFRDRKYTLMISKYNSSYTSYCQEFLDNNLVHLISICRMLITNRSFLVSTTTDIQLKSLKVSTSSLGKTTGSINVNPISLKQVGVQSDTNEKFYFDGKIFLIISGTSN